MASELEPTTTSTTTSPRDVAAAHDAEAAAVPLPLPPLPSSTLHIEESDVLRTRRKFTHTSEAQRLSMLEWLEQPPNFQLLTGGAGPPLVNAAGKKLKKTDGFRSLMRHVNARTDAQWTIEVTRSRYESLMAAFRKTQSAAERGDLSVTANDRVRGISDARQKLNAMCLFYDRLDALFKTGKPLMAVADQLMVEPAAADGSHADKNGGVRTLKGEDKAVGGKRDAGDGPRSDGSVAVLVANGDHARAVERDTLLATRVYASSSPARRTSSSPPSAKRLKLRHHASPSLGAVLPAAPVIASPAIAAAASPAHDAFSTESDGEEDAHEAVESHELEPVDPPQSDVHEPSAAAAAAVAAAVASDDAVKLKQIDMETQKLALQQDQLALQKRELELKEKELVAQESMKKQAVRAELTTKLVVAGKSLAEIKEFLELLG